MAYSTFTMVLPGIQLVDLDSTSPCVSDSRYFCTFYVRTSRSEEEFVSKQVDFA